MEKEIQDATKMMIYSLALRVRLYIASKLSEENRFQDLSDLEALLLEIIDTKGSMSISEISHFYPKVSASTISTTISRLWKEKKLVDKNILPENQRITAVNLSDGGRRVLDQIKKRQTDVYSTVAKSLGLSSEWIGPLQEMLEKSIAYLDELLGLRFN